MNYNRSTHIEPGRAFGIWSFVLAFFVQVLALVFGIIGLIQSRRAGVRNPWAIGGIAISSVVIAAAIVATVAVATSGGFAAG
jgi:hypothetical protein